MNTTLGPFPPQAVNIIQLIFEVVIAIVTIVENVLVIYVIMKTPSLHRYTNYFLFSLSISGIFIGAVVLPFQITVDLDLITGVSSLCVWTHVLVLVNFMAVVLTMFVLSVERALAVLSPFLYGRIATERLTWYVIMCIWLMTVWDPWMVLSQRKYT